MSPPRLKLQQLQNELRGHKVISAGRSVGSCILINFKADRRRRNGGAAKPGLMVELAKWKLLRGGTVMVSSNSWPRAINSILPRLAGTRIVDASIMRHGVELVFEKGFTLMVSKLTPSELGPGWKKLDQWVLFDVRNDAICQPVRGQIAWAQN